MEKCNGEWRELKNNFAEFQITTATNNGKLNLIIMLLLPTVVFAGTSSWKALSSGKDIDLQNKTIAMLLENINQQKSLVDLHIARLEAANKENTERIEILEKEEKKKNKKIKEIERICYSD